MPRWKEKSAERRNYLKKRNLKKKKIKLSKTMLSKIAAKWCPANLEMINAPHRWCYFAP